MPCWAQLCAPGPRRRNLCPPVYSTALPTFFSGVPAFQKAWRARHVLELGPYRPGRMSNVTIKCFVMKRLPALHADTSPRWHLPVPIRLKGNERPGEKGRKDGEGEGGCGTANPNTTVTQKGLNKVSGEGRAWEPRGIQSRLRRAQCRHRCLWDAVCDHTRKKSSG